jgi:hypothetical protein
MTKTSPRYAMARHAGMRSAASSGEEGLPAEEPISSFEEVSDAEDPVSRTRRTGHVRLRHRRQFVRIVVDRHTLETVYESAEVYWQHQSFSARMRDAVTRLPPDRIGRIGAEMMTALARHRRGTRFAL